MELVEIILIINCIIKSLLTLFFFFLQLKEKNKEKLEIRMIHAKHDLMATFGSFGG